MKIFFSIFFFVFLFQPIVAQENNSYSKEKIIRWPKFFKAQIPENVTAVAGIQVIPLVWDRERLGYVQVGLNNKKVSARPDKSFTPFLQEYIQKQYGDDYKKTGMHLLWIVKDLRINERTLFSNEQAFTRLKADAYFSADGTAYQFVVAFDTVIRRGGVDLTGWHGQFIAEAFHLLLKQSLQKNDALKTDASMELLTVQEIVDKEKRKLNIPILNDMEYKEGVYASFNEFLENQPSITAFEAIKENEEIIFYEMAGTGKKQLPLPWGVCKGGELYKCGKDDLIPLERMGNGFIISTYLENSNRRNNSLFWGAMLGGAVGAVIASATTTSAKIYTVTAIPYITKKQPEACAIDMTTGELTF